MQHENRLQTQIAPPRNGFEAIKTDGQGKSLTGKQEKFALGVATGMSQADAYRAAFDATKMKAETIQEEASRLMADRKVTARVDAHRIAIGAKVAEEFSYEYGDAMRELDKAIVFARECKAPGALVAALSLKQKISGLHVEERKNNLSPIDSMSPERVRAILETVQAIKKARAASTGQAK